MENERFIKDFAMRLSRDLKEIKSKMRKENVKLVTKNRQPIASDFAERDTVRDADTLLNPPINEDHFHKPAFTEAQRKDGGFAFVPLDVEKKIHICLDKLYFIDPVHPDKTLRQEHCLDVTETLIHEAAHSIGVSCDITYISTEEGKLAPVLDAIDEYQASIVEGLLDDKESMVKIQDEYMRMHPEYTRFTDWARNDNNILNYMFSHDVGFKSNVLLTTPDLFSIFVRDLYLNSAVMPATP